MNTDFENDFIGSVATAFFMPAAALTLIATFAYFLSSTGSFIAAVLGAVTIGAVAGIFFGAVSAIVGCSVALVFKMLAGRSS